MPSTCIVIGCKSRGSIGPSDVKFFRFPLLDRRTHNSLVLSQTRQNALLDILKKPNFVSRLYKNARICNLHFISGKSANLYDVKNPDWVPSLNMGCEQPVILETQPAFMNLERANTDYCETPMILTCSSKSMSTQTDYVEIRCKANSRDSGTQTEPSLEPTGICTDAEYARMSTVAILQNRIRYLEEMIPSHLVKVEISEENDVNT